MIFKNNRAGLTGNYNGGAIDAKTVYINTQNGTFINNSATKYGACIYTNGSSCYIVNCDFINNTSSEYGVITLFTNADIINCSFIGNINTNLNSAGSAIYVTKCNKCNIYGCYFENNCAYSKQWGGGVIVNSKVSNFVVDNCIFKNNRINITGGVIYTDGEGSKIINSIFINNYANEGGAIFLSYDASNSIIDNCTFINNTANKGSAIYDEQPGSSIKNCKFESNSTNSEIYIINNDKTTTVALNNNTFDYINKSVPCITLESGQIISKTSATVLNNKTVCISPNSKYNITVVFVDDNNNSIAIKSIHSLNGDIIHTLTNNGNYSYCEYTAVYRAEPYIVGTTCTSLTNLEVKTATILIGDKDSFTYLNFLIFSLSDGDNLTLDKNYHMYGYEIASFNSGITISNKKVIIVGNNSVINANSTGRIFNIDSTGILIMNNASLINGYFLGDGGAIYNKGIAIFDNCTFKNNRVTVSGSILASGGAIYNNGAVNCTVINSLFEDNNAKSYGGAIFYQTSKFYIDNTTFLRNHASKGGSIYISHIDTVDMGKIVDSKFTSNYATDDGGVIYINEPNVNIINCSFNKNNATNGAVIYTNDNNCLISYCNFTDNEATNKGIIYNNGQNSFVNYCNFNTNIVTAVVIYNVGSDYNISSCNFTGNGSMIYNEANNLIVENCIFNGDSKSVAIINTGTNPKIKNNIFFNCGVDDHKGTVYVNCVLTILIDGKSFILTTTNNFNLTSSLVDSNNNTFYSDGLTYKIYNSTGLVKEVKANELFEVVTNISYINSFYNVTAVYNDPVDKLKKYSVKNATLIPSNSFTVLESLIKNSTTINLNSSHVLYAEEANIYKNGFIINKTINIDGKGFSIDANNLGRIFNVTNEGNLTLNNVVLLNGNSSLASTIYNSGSLTLINSTIENDNNMVDLYLNGGSAFLENNTFNSDLPIALVSGVINSNVVAIVMGNDTGNVVKRSHYIVNVTFYDDNGNLISVLNANMTINNTNVSLVNHGNYSSCDYLVKLVWGNYTVGANSTALNNLTVRTGKLVVSPYYDFEDLEKFINTSGEIYNLNHNFTMNIDEVDKYKDGIKINKKITINGNGFTIDANNTGAVFNLYSNSNIILYNITIINGNHSNGAIYNSQSYINLNITNSTFINNTGGAISDGLGSSWIANNLFINNGVSGSSTVYNNLVLTILINGESGIIVNTSKTFNLTASLIDDMNNTFFSNGLTYKIYNKSGLVGTIDADGFFNATSSVSSDCFYNITASYVDPFGKITSYDVVNVTLFATDSFSALQYLINNSKITTFDLANDIVWYDEEVIDEVRVNKSIVINGNGFKFVGGKFNITGSLTLNNIVWVNSTDTAIYNKGTLDVDNCTFINNTNGAIVNVDGTASVVNSVFINNSVSGVSTVYQGCVLTIKINNDVRLIIIPGESFNLTATLVDNKNNTFYSDGLTYNVYGENGFVTSFTGDNWFNATGSLSNSGFYNITASYVDPFGELTVYDVVNVTLFPVDSFSALQYLVDKNSIVNLTNNYKLYDYEASAFTGGIKVNKSVIINGNGFTVDANNVCVFNVTGSLKLNNLTIVNAFCGVYNTGDNLLVDNCTFVNNTVAAINNVGGTNPSVIDSVFYNCKVDGVSTVYQDCVITILVNGYVTAIAYVNEDYNLTSTIVDNKGNSFFSSGLTYKIYDVSSSMWSVDADNLFNAVFKVPSYNFYNITASFTDPFGKISSYKVKNATLSLIPSFGALDFLMNYYSSLGIVFDMEHDYIKYVDEIAYYFDGITINKTVTIDGHGFTIDANGTGRIFNVTNGASLILKNVNLVNCGRLLGAVAFINGGNITFINCTFSDNYAGDYSLIYNNGNLTLDSCHFINNSGSIYNLDTLYLSSNNFDNDTEVIYLGDGGRIVSKTYLKFLNGNVVDCQVGKIIKLYVVLVDDNGNMICNDTISVNVNDTSLGNLIYENGSYYLNYTPDSTGTFLIHGSSTSCTDCNVTNCTLIVKAKSPTINITVDNIVYGENASFVVYLNGEGEVLSGKVNVTIDGKVYTIDVIDGVGTGHSIVLGSGNYTATVYWNGTDVYTSISNITTFNISKSNDASVNVTVTNETYGANATITVNLKGVLGEGLNGAVVVTIDGRNYTVNVVDGVGSNSTVILANGTYTVSVYWAGNDNYTSRFNSTSFNISQASPFMNVTVSNEIYGANATITVNLKGVLGEVLNGTVVVTIDGRNYTVNVVDGVGSNSTVILANGTYIATVYWVGNQNYTNKSNSTSFNISQASPYMNVTVSNETYGTNATITVYLRGVLGEALDGTVVVTIDGRNYTVNVVGGVGSNSTIVLANGTYSVSAYWTGNQNYTNQTNNTSFNITQSNNASLNVTVSDVVYGANATITVYLRGVLDEALEGVVTVRIAGKDYIVNVVGGVGSNSTIVLANGTYSVSAYWDGNENYTNKSNSTSFNISQASPYVNVTVTNVTYGNYATITVNLMGVLGEALDGTVIVTINGKDYVVNVRDGVGTNQTVILDQKVYTANAYWDGNQNYTSQTNNTLFNVSKTNSTLKVVVDEIIFGEKSTITVYLDGVNGEKLNGTVVVTIAGKDYIVDVKNGVGTNMTDILAATTYEVIANWDGNNNYYNNSNKTDLVISKSTNVVLNVDVDNVVYGTNATITVKLRGIFDEALNGTVIVTINNKNYTVNVRDGIGTNMTDVLGVKSSYSVVAYWAGNVNYTNKSASNSFKVSQASPTVNITVTNETYGIKNNVTVYLTGSMDENLTGDVIVTINDKEYTVHVVNGVGSLLIDILSVNTYVALAKWSGNDNYTEMSDNVNFKVTPASPFINITVTNETYGDKSTITINLKGVLDEALDGNVIVTINGVSHQFSVTGGVKVVEMAFNAGNYSVEVFWEGNNNYKNVTNRTSFIVNNQKFFKLCDIY